MGKTNNVAVKVLFCTASLICVLIIADYIYASSATSALTSNLTMSARIKNSVTVDLSGNSGFYCDIEADEVDMELSGTSYAEGFVDASDFDLNMSGGSEATLRGQATTLDLALSGASTIKRTITGSNYGLECDFCNGTMSGSSVAYIHCNAKVNVILSGASELHFTGDGDSTSSQTSGGSRIIHDEQP